MILTWPLAMNDPNTIPLTAKSMFAFSTQVNIRVLEYRRR
jgi:hypothetical protein